MAIAQFWYRQKIQQTLNLVGNHTDVSRVYVFENNVQGTETSNTYEWCNNGASPQIAQLQNIPYKNIPSFKKIINKHGHILSTNINELPHDLVALLKPLEIKSILNLPLYVQNNFFGFIGFDECAKEKLWEDEEVELLRTVAGNLSNFIERQILEEQLRESEIRQKLALENTRAGLWDWNIKTGEVFHNEIWCKMLGYNNNEVEPNLGSWKKLIHPDDVPSAMQDLSSHVEGKTNHYENTYRLLTKSGEWKWIIDKGKIIEYDENGNALRAIGTHIDIDIQKKVEEELREADITKDKFFSILAHDLREPIASMIQLSQVVLDKDSFDKTTLYTILNSQVELSKSTFQLLENLLSWARYNRKQIQCSPKQIDLNALIDENIASVKYKANQKGISIIKDYSKLFVAYADGDMVNLIIRNLLSNALKFTENGGFIRIELKDKAKHIEIKIVDTGIGISEENTHDIMSDNEFYSTLGTAKEKGSGLGLRLCRSFIAQNGGDFTIDSKPNEGTSFSFTLPVPGL